MEKKYAHEMAFQKLININLVLFVMFISSISFAQTYSATDSVMVSTLGTYTGNGRGFKFTPNVNVNVTALGKRIPSSVGTYTWTIWNNSTNSIVHQQVSTSITPGVYTYEPITTPVQLLQGVSYSLMMYCDGTAGAQYYYGTSTQINSNLTYTQMVFCNSCTPNTPSNSTLTNYHYGTPDFHFTTCTPGTSTDTRTECSGFTWMNGVSYTSNNNTATHSISGAAANGCDSIVTLNLTILPTPIGIQTVTACDSFVWINGYNYTISTQVATHVLPGAAASGCDSIAKLHLTIFNKKYGTDTRTECAGFIWIDGNSYYANNTSATATISGGASNGCDSIVTLNLTVNTVDVSLTVVDPTMTANLVGASYQWLDCGNGNIAIAGATSQTYVPVLNGIYSAKITENGCVDTSACTTIAAAGLEMNSFYKGVSFSPNPTTGIVNFNFGDLNDLDVYVFNSAGELVYSEKNIENNIHQIELNESSGIYFIEFISKDQNQKYKLVIQ